MNYRNNVEIRKCANGYIVYPSREESNRMFQNGDEILVFNSFDEMSARLKAEMPTKECPPRG